jgi:hypothetical protein
MGAAPSRPGTERSIVVAAFGEFRCTHLGSCAGGTRWSALSESWECEHIPMSRSRFQCPRRSTPRRPSAATSSTGQTCRIRPALSEESEDVPWPYTGPESISFFPPGSIEEHLLTDHGSAPWRSGGTPKASGTTPQKPASTQGDWRAVRATAALGRTADKAVAGSGSDHRGPRIPPTNAQLSTHGRFLALTGSASRRFFRCPPTVATGRTCLSAWPLGGVVRPRRVVRFARLVHAAWLRSGEPAVRAAFGGTLSLNWQPRNVAWHL